MNLRDAEIRGKVNSWLDRFAVPSHLADKPQAAQQEAEAILRMFLRYAPRDDVQPFLNRAFDNIDAAKKSRYWPTPHEIGDVCSALAKRDARPVADSSTDMRPEAITGRRMAAGEAVGEGWLYGRLAVDLIAGGHVTKEVMTAYRSAAFFNRKDLYGEGAALEWEAEAKERHEAARVLHRTRNDPKGSYDTAAIIGEMA